VSAPGINFDMPQQIRMRGKVRNFKPARNVQDIITNRELQVNFRSVDANLNYWLMFDIINKHYLDVENQFIHPFTISCVDIHRDVIYIIKFYEIILKSLTDITLNYSQQKVSPSEFTLSFNFNFYDIEFMLDQSKVLELGTLPTIIQKI
jgi:hypothetical protein